MEWILTIGRCEISPPFPGRRILMRATRLILAALCICSFAIACSSDKEPVENIRTSSSR